MKVLIVTYYWPPSGGSGVQRWMYFAKHLEENGIEPIVVTINPENAAFASVDYSLLEQVKHVKTHYTSGGFQLLKLYSFLKSGSTKKQIPVGNFGNKKKSIFDKLSGYIRANYFIPDARVGWNKKAIPLVEELIKKENITIIITTGPPHSTHLIGLEIKKRHNHIKWLADFRDPWTEVYYNTLFKKNKRADKKDRSLELEVLEKSDLVLTIGPSMKELLENKIPRQKDKVHSILNGFDDTLLNGIKGERYPEFTIAHIGILTLQQAHKEIIESLKNILTENKEWVIRFVLVGNIHPEIIEELTKIPNLIIDHRGKVSQKDALQEMMNADVLLNCLAILPNSKILISGKLMEYLATGNSMVVIGDKEGDAAGLMKNIENASMISPNDIETLSKTIAEIYQKERTQPCLSTKMNQFSRKSTTKLLAELIQSKLITNITTK